VDSLAIGGLSTLTITTRSHSDTAESILWILFYFVDEMFAVDKLPVPAMDDLFLDKTYQPRLWDLPTTLLCTDGLSQHSASVTTHKGSRKPSFN
jgi:hypothetical protein